jgi:hypothetical protein
LIFARKRMSLAARSGPNPARTSPCTK